MLCVLFCFPFLVVKTRKQRKNPKRTTGKFCTFCCVLHKFEKWFYLAVILRYIAPNSSLGSCCTNEPGSNVGLMKAMVATYFGEPCEVFHCFVTLSIANFFLGNRHWWFLCLSFRFPVAADDHTTHQPLTTSPTLPFVLFTCDNLFFLIDPCTCKSPAFSNQNKIPICMVRWYFCSKFRKRTKELEKNDASVIWLLSEYP